MLGRLIAEAVKGVLIATALVVLGLIFGISIASGPLGFVLLVGLTALWSVVFVGFMQLIALKTRSAARRTPAGLIFFPLLFLTPNFVPRDLLTRPMEIAATLNPVTYVMEALRSLLLEDLEWGTILPGFAVVAVLGALMLVLNVRMIPPAPPKDGRYELTAVSRKWLLRDSPNSLADKLLLQFLEWDWMESSEDYVRTGEPLELHSMTDAGDWELYQRGMRAMANAVSAEAIRRMPAPKDLRSMLDIGGSHGYYSAALCRSYQGLSAVILDLPDAVEQAPRCWRPRAGRSRRPPGRERAHRRHRHRRLRHRPDRPAGPPLLEEQNRQPAQRSPRAAPSAACSWYSTSSGPRARATPARSAPCWSSTSRSRASRGPGRPRRSPAGSARLASPRRPIRFRTAPGAGVQAAFSRAATPRSRRERDRPTPS